MAEVLLRHNCQPELGLDLLRRSGSAALSEPLPARDRWELLLRCAELSVERDGSLAHDFYRKAVESAESIDDESARLLVLQHELAAHCQDVLGVEAEPTALRIARLAEAHRRLVSEPDIVPHDGTIAAVTRLAPPRGIALASRWDDERVLDLARGLPVAIRAARECAYIDSVEALALLRLAGESYDLAEDAVVSLTSVNAELERERLIENVVRRTLVDLEPPVRDSVARSILEWADNNGHAANAEVSKLRDMVGFSDDLKRSDGRSGPRDDVYDWKSDRQAEEEELASLLETAASGSLDSLESRLMRAWELGAARGHEQFLDALRGGVAQGSRVALLESLVSLSSMPSFLILDVARSLTQMLREWWVMRPVRTWGQDGVPRFISNHLASLLAYDDASSREAVRDLLSTACLSVERQMRSLIRGAELHLGALNASQLYRITSELCSGASPSEVQGVLQWSLERLERQCSIAGAPSEPASEASSADCLASLFWALFGHPDKRIRWRALHAARDVAHLGQHRLPGASAAPRRQHHGGPPPIE